jgi:hypothetical protein
MLRNHTLEFRRVAAPPRFFKSLLSSCVVGAVAVFFIGEMAFDGDAVLDGPLAMGEEIPDPTIAKMTQSFMAFARVRLDRFGCPATSDSR